ncbi:DUF1763-domain-containing protein [Saccharata proteae CBS 121410]|uniref:DUF1763-domain-containing protein n=1 Tax=Saccharata proteae CBS 121410 TaxID=1314787 RepID=A0A9P4HP99_9PEZI|nr:DUF1763-domain-containing protein [Saccharata proteae CBS 121410]
MSASRQDILRAYRHIFTHSLRAVQYSTPSRYTVRDRLRHVFRTNSPEAFDQAKIDNTIEFLKGATREKGIEHKVVKTLVDIWWDEPTFRRKPQAHNAKEVIRATRTAHDPMYHAIRMLNESMGMCIQ